MSSGLTVKVMFSDLCLMGLPCILGVIPAYAHFKKSNDNPKS